VVRPCSVQRQQEGRSARRLEGQRPKGWRADHHIDCGLHAPLGGLGDGWWLLPLPPLKLGDLQRRRGDGDFERGVVVLGSQRACLCGLRWGVRSLLRPLVLR